MGYIMPVQNYQYEQYHLRQVGTAYDPFHTIPVQKIQPHRSSETQYNSLHTTIDRVSAYTQKLGVGLANRNKPAEKLYSDLTGKGRSFNQSV